MASPFQVGDFVQMNVNLHDHDIVRYQDYEVVGISARGSLFLRNVATGKLFDGRTPDAFHLVDRGGPW